MAIGAVRLIRRLLTPSMARFGARHATVGREKLEIHRDGNGLYLTVRLILLGAAAESRPLFLDFTSSTMRLLHASGRHIGVFFPKSDRPALLSAALDRGATWNEATIDVTLEWPTCANDSRRTPCVLVLPDHLPEPLTVAPQGSPPLPLISLDQELPTGFVFGGIGAYTKSDELQQNALQLWIAPDETIRHSSEELYMTSTLTRQISKSDVTRIRERTTDVLHFLGSLFGFLPTLRLAAVAPGDIAWRAEPMGSCFQITPDEIVEQLSPLHSTLPFRLARIWCGKGVQLHGSRANSVYDGVGFAVTLLWLKHIGYHAAFNRTYEHLRQGSAGSGARILFSLFGRGTVGETARLALAMFEGFQNTSLRAEMGKIFLGSWGRSVHAELVIKRLTTAGLPDIT